MFGDGVYQCVGMHYNYLVNVQLYEDQPHIVVRVYKIGLTSFSELIELSQTADRLATAFTHVDTVLHERNLIATHGLTQETLRNDGIEISRNNLEDILMYDLRDKVYVPRYFEKEKRVTFEKSWKNRELYVLPGKWMVMMLDSMSVLPQMRISPPWQIITDLYDLIFSTHKQPTLLTDTNKLTPLNTQKTIKIVSDSSEEKENVEEVESSVNFCLSASVTGCTYKTSKHIAKKIEALLPQELLEQGSIPHVEPRNLDDTLSHDGALLHATSSLEGELIKALNKLREEVQQNKGKTEELTQQIKQHQKAINALSELRKEKEIAVLEQKQILGHKDPQVKLFYQTLISNLCVLFSSALLVNKSRVALLAHKPGTPLEKALNGDRTTSVYGEQKEGWDWLWEKIKLYAGKTLETLNLLKPLAGALSKINPEIPDFVGGAVPGVLDFITGLSDQGKLGNSEETLRGHTLRTLESAASAVARKVTFSYEQQIVLLKTEGVKALADSALESIASALFNGQVSNEDLILNSWLSIRNIQCSHHNWGPRAHQEGLKGRDGKTYHADQLFRFSGIEYLQDGAVQQSLLDSENKDFGYFRVSKEEFKIYFSKNRQAVVTDLAPKKQPNKVECNNHVLWDLLQEHKKERKNLRLLFAKAQKEMQETQKTMAEIEERMNRNDEQYRLLKNEIKQIRQGEVSGTAAEKK